MTTICKQTYKRVPRERCIVCNKFIPEDEQTLQRKTCSKRCAKVMKTNQEFQNEINFLSRNGFDERN